MQRSFRVAVVAVGDELLLGEIVDTNTGWIGNRLAGVGAPVVRATVVGDDHDTIAAAVVEATGHADFVVVTGGLGPTSDDVTAPALLTAASAAGGTPEGASASEALANPVGTAAGLLVDVRGTPVVALPGVPQEMQAMVEAHVVPRLRDERRAVRVVELRTALVGESELAARLRPLEADLPSGVRVAYLAGPAEVRVRIVATAADPGPCAARAQQLLGDLVVAVDESLEARVCRLLRDRSATVATAESLTGGLLGAAITGVAGASAVYSGGVVAYATEAKTALLGVDAELLATVGPVHREVALAMAAGVRQRFATTYGVATTGVAGPEPQGGQPVGTVHVAVVGPDGARALLLRRGGWRDAVRRRAVVAALELVRRAALGLDPHPAESSG